MKNLPRRFLTLLMAVILLVQLLPAAAMAESVPQSEAGTESTLKPGDADWSRAELLTLTTEEANRYLELGGDLTNATPDSVRALLGEDVGGGSLGEDASEITGSPGLEGISSLTKEPGEVELSYYVTDENGRTAVLNDEQLSSALRQAAEQESLPEGSSPDEDFLGCSDSARLASWEPARSVTVISERQMGFAAFENNSLVKNTLFRVDFYRANENGVKADTSPTYSAEWLSPDGSVIFGPEGDRDVDCPVGGSLAGSWVVDIYVKTPVGFRDAYMTNVLLCGGTGTDINLSEDDGSVYFAGAAYEVTDILNDSDRIITSPELDVNKTFTVWLQKSSGSEEVQVELFQENEYRTELYSIGKSDFAVIPGGSSDPVSFTLCSDWCTKLLPARKVGFRVLDREGSTLAVCYPNITVEKSLIDRPKVDKIKFGIFSGLAGSTLPEDIPVIGGGKVGAILPSFPIEISVDLDGSATVGINISVSVYDSSKSDDITWKYKSLRERTNFVDQLKSRYNNAMDAYTRAKGAVLDSSMLVGAANISFVKCNMYGMGLLTGSYNPEDGYAYVSGSLMVQMSCNASLASQVIIVVVPVYIGIDMSASFGLMATLSMRFAPSDFLDSFELLGDDSGLTLNVAAEFGFVAGVGVRNVCAVDAKGYVGINYKIPIILASNLGKINLYAGAKLSATAVFLYYEKVLCYKDVDVYDKDSVSEALMSGFDLRDAQWVDLTQTEAFRENIQTRETGDGVFVSDSGSTFRSTQTPDCITEQYQELYCGVSTSMSPAAQPKVSGDNIDYLANVQLSDGSILTLPHRAELPADNGELGTPRTLLDPDTYAKKYLDDARYVYDYGVRDVTNASGGSDTLVLAAARGEAGESPDSTASTLIASQNNGTSFLRIDSADSPIRSAGIAQPQQDAPYAVYSYYQPDINAVVAGLWSTDSSYRPYYRPDRQHIFIFIPEGSTFVTGIPAGCYLRYVYKTADEIVKGEPLYWLYHIPYGYYVVQDADGEYSLMCWDLSAWDGKSDYSNVTPRITKLISGDDIQDLWSCARYQYTETYFRCGNAVYSSYCSDSRVTCSKYISPEGIDLSAYTLSYSAALGDVRVMAMSVIDPTGDGTIAEEDRAPGVEKKTTLYIWRRDSQQVLHEARKIELPGYAYSAAQLTLNGDDTLRVLLYNYGMERSTLDILQEEARTNIDMVSCIAANRFVGEGEPLRFRAVFRNNGTTEVRGLTLGLYDADESGSSAPLALLGVDLFHPAANVYRNFLPGDEVTVDISCVCPSLWTSGTHSFYLRVIDETASPVDTMETDDGSLQLDVSHWAENTPKVNLWLRRARETAAAFEPPVETLRISVSDDGENWTTWKTLDLSRELCNTRTVPAQADTLTLDLTESVGGVAPFSGSRANYAQIRYEFIKDGSRLLLGDFYLGGGLYGMPVSVGSDPVSPLLELKDISDAQLYTVTLPDGEEVQLSVDGHIFEGVAINGEHEEYECLMAALNFTTDYVPESSGDGTRDGMVDLLYEEPEGFAVDICVAGTPYTVRLRSGEMTCVNIPLIGYFSEGGGTDLSCLLGESLGLEDIKPSLSALEEASLSLNWSDTDTSSYLVIGDASLELDVSELPNHYALTLRNHSVTAAEVRLAVYADSDSEPFFVLDSTGCAEELGALTCADTVNVRIPKAELEAALEAAGRDGCGSISFRAEAKEFNQSSMNSMLAAENDFDASRKELYEVSVCSNSVVFRSTDSVWVSLHSSSPELGTVSVGAASGADASASFGLFTEGVTISAAPAEGARFRFWADAAGKVISSQNPCVLPALDGHTLLYAVFADSSDPCEGFTDVDRSAWYHGAVDYVLENGMMMGFTSELFRPDTPLTRAMLCRIFYNMAACPDISGDSPFTDVTEDKWYYSAVVWAAGEKLVVGYGDGSFGPDDVLTREQLAMILYRYEQSCGGGFDGDWEYEPGFTDADRTYAGAREAVQWCVTNRVINGWGDGTLRPGDLVTRAQTAQVLKNYFTLK
ncbi:MAG: S-layer homology domain-containing protein [Oscillospiraceae bacterium]|nr:S-layer homology domain-containing protein [Oscillospiraceae bacterium]